MNHSPENTPWYREAWVWFFLGILGLGIIAGTTMLVIGVSNPPEMVVGDYARFARGLVDTNERAGRAQALGLKGQLLLDQQRITITLNQASNQPLPNTLTALFQHPATSAQDVRVRLTQIDPGLYVGELAETPHPRARAVITDLAETWWLSTPENATLDLGTLPILPHRL